MVQDGTGTAAVAFKNENEIWSKMSRLKNKTAYTYQAALQAILMAMIWISRMRKGKEYYIVQVDSRASLEAMKR